jgi:pimeloyl-ACP methyl ester carboxylesterase
VEERRVRYRWVPRAADGDSRREATRIRAPRAEIGVPARLPLKQPLLLIHGLAGSADVWRPTLRCLEQQELEQPVVAPDMPGYGRSAGPRGALGMVDLADWMARLLDTLSISSAHVAAHSMGCQVALALARRHPARVGALVLAAPTTGRRLMPPWRYLAGMLRCSREPLSYRPTAARLYLQMGLRRYVATVRKMLEDDPLADVGSLRAPSLVVSGEWDGIIPGAIARALAEALPNGQFATLPRAAHVAPSHRPEAFTRAMLQFLITARDPEGVLLRS